MKKLFFSPNVALLLILALILPPSYAPSRVSLSNHRPELSRRTLRPSNAGMEESKVRGQLETALNPPDGGPTELTPGLEERTVSGRSGLIQASSRSLIALRNQWVKEKKRRFIFKRVSTDRSQKENNAAAAAVTHNIGVLIKNIVTHVVFYPKDKDDVRPILNQLDAGVLAPLRKAGVGRTFVFPKSDDWLAVPLFEYAAGTRGRKMLLEMAKATARLSPRASALAFGRTGPHLRAEFISEDERMDIPKAGILLRGFLPYLERLLSRVERERTLGGPNHALELEAQGYVGALWNGLMFPPYKGEQINYQHHYKKLKRMLGRKGARSLEHTLGRSAAFFPNLLPETPPLFLLYHNQIFSSDEGVGIVAHNEWRYPGKDKISLWDITVGGRGARAYMEERSFDPNQAVYGQWGGEAETAYSGVRQEAMKEIYRFLHQEGSWALRKPAAGLEEGKQPWPWLETGAVGAIAGGLLGTGSATLVPGLSPREIGMTTLLSMALGTSAAYAIRAGWFRPRILRGVDRLLREGEKTRPGLRNQFFALREAIRPRVHLADPNNRVAQKLHPDLVDWITYWVQWYELAFPLGLLQQVVFRVERQSRGESSAGHQSMIEGGLSVIHIAISEEDKHLAKARQAQIKSLERQMAKLSEASSENAQAQSDEQRQTLQDVKQRLRKIQIMAQPLGRHRNYGQWVDVALATEAFHSVERWVQVAAGMPTLFRESDSAQESSNRLNLDRKHTIQGEAGDHLSNLITKAWSPEYMFLVGEDLSEGDKNPGTNNHALATLISRAAFEKVEEWVRNGKIPDSFQDRLLFRMVQLNSLINATVEYGKEEDAGEEVYRGVMKRARAPDVLTEFWLEDRADVMPLARFARSIQNLKSPADLYDRLHARIGRLTENATVRRWLSSLSKEQQALKAAGVEETSAASVEGVEGMARMNNFLEQVGSDPSVLFGTGLHDLTESFGESPAIEAFRREGVRPLLLVLPDRLSLPGASLDSPVLKLLVDPKYDRALKKQLSLALVSGIVKITTDPSAARFVVGDRDFVRNQQENRLVSREATFLQVDPSTISSLTQDFLTLVAAYKPGSVLVVGTQTERSDAVVLFESA